MSTSDRTTTEVFRTLRAFIFGIFFALGARELSEYAAKGNKVVADFNREVAQQNVNELQRLFRAPQHEEE